MDRTRAARIPRATGAVLARVCVLLLAAVVLTGCGPNGDGAAAPATTSAAVTDPGEVALRYAQALFAGDVDQARSLVAPSSRSAFELVAAGIPRGQISAEDLAAGSTDVQGDAARVILTGRLCRREGASASASPDCLENTDPHSTNPIFTVGLARQTDRSWLVRLGLPQSADAPDSTSPPEATASASAR